MICLVDAAGRYTYVSPASRVLLGWSPGELVGRSSLEMVHPDDLAGVRSKLRDAVEGRPPVYSQFRMLRRDGTLVWVEASLSPPAGGESTYGVVTRDITDRKELDELLRAAALRDAVTGLANRRMLDDELESAVARAERGGAGFGLVFLDLDGFKALNDQLGHSSGDDVLRAVAARLEGTVRRGDLAARYGGDEFVALCLDLKSDTELEETAGRVAEAIAQPIRLGDRTANVRASTGTALWSASTTAQQLLEQADLAMYLAKRNGT